MAGLVSDERRGLVSDRRDKRIAGINQKDPTNFRDGLRKRMLAAQGGGDE